LPFLRPSEKSDEIGRLGGYRVLSLLGSGGMGMVFRAEDPALRRMVALKVINPRRIVSAEARTRFLAEARSLAALEHDHIVQVFQVGEDNGVPFLAMQMLRGESLQQRLNRAGKSLPIDEVLRIGREIAEGLAAAHECGIIHRDIKPGNIWLEARGPVTGSSELQAERPHAGSRVKILDFGLARVVAADTPDTDAASAALQGADTLTESRPHTVLGTPAYMAPEQAGGQPVDSRADLFAVGCVLYRMSTGSMPFEGSTAVDVLMRVVAHEPPRPRHLNPAIPVDVEELIIRLMRKQPDERPASALAVVQCVRAIEAARRPKPSRWGCLLGTTGAVLLGAALAAWAALTWQQPPAPPEPVEIRIDYDEPDAQLALRLGNDAEQIIDIRKKPTIALAPGDYALRSVADPGKRHLRPPRLLVQPGVKEPVTVRLVGELDRNEVHGPQPVRGLAAVRRKDTVVVLSVGANRLLAGWRPGSGLRPQQRLFPDSMFACAALAPDGRTLATGCIDPMRRAGNFVRFWDAETFEPRAGGFDGQVNALAYSRDSAHLLAGLNNGAVVLWDARAGQSAAEREDAHDSGVFAVAFLPDGKRLLTTDWDGTIAQWAVDRKGGATVLVQLWTMPGHTGVARGLVVLPGGKQAVTAGIDRAIRVWDLGSGKSTTSWTAPEPVHALALSPDGKRLLSGEANGTVRLWDLGTRQEIENFTGHVTTVTALAFTPDGERAVSGDKEGVVIFWRLPS
jgi:serine/threonine protein kinase